MEAARTIIMAEIINEHSDLCKSCKKMWFDFPLPLDHYEAHCEILDEKHKGLLDDNVEYPCLKCPFDAYDKK